MRNASGRPEHLLGLHWGRVRVFWGAAWWDFLSIQDTSDNHLRTSQLLAKHHSHNLWRSKAKPIVCIVERTIAQFLSLSVKMQNSERGWAIPMLKSCCWNTCRRVRATCWWGVQHQCLPDLGRTSRAVRSSLFLLRRQYRGVHALQSTPGRLPGDWRPKDCSSSYRVSMNNISNLSLS